MDCKPPPIGFKFCIENSGRLFKDACSLNISLPTTGALLEIGIEEAAKGYLLLVSLLTEGDLPEKIVNSSFKDPEGFFKDTEIKIRNSPFVHFFDQDEVESDLEKAFRKQEIKLDLLRMMSLLFNEMAYDELVSSENLTKEKECNLKVRIISEISKVISPKIKESGFYVDCSPQGFIRPYLERDTILKMAQALLELITGLSSLGRILYPGLFIDFTETELMLSLRTLSGKLGN